MNETRSPVPCRNVIVIDPRWQLDDLVKAYTNLLYDNEHPETLTLQNTSAPVFRQFVIAAELGLKCMEGENDGDVDVAIAAAEHGDWLTKADVARTLDWLGSRANERDLQMVYDVKSVGPHAHVLNSDQLPQPTVETLPTAVAASIAGEDSEKQDKLEQHNHSSLLTGSSSDIPFNLVSDDDDEADNGDTAGRNTPPRKRQCSNDSSILESPSKKVRVKEEEKGDKEVVIIDPLVPAEAASFVHRRRWTASQQFAMLSTLYTVGYGKADWEAIAARVNVTNPQGQPKSKTRVKSAMRETHWSKFLQANNDGTFGRDQLTISFPDMSGPPTSTGAAWTSQQKQTVWFETFAFAERNVNWKDVARAVNAAANGDQTLYRKPLDCEKTWRDTLRRHFGLQGRERR